MKYLNIAKLTCIAEFLWWGAVTYCTFMSFCTGVHSQEISRDTSFVIMCLIVWQTMSWVSGALQ